MSEPDIRSFKRLGGAEEIDCVYAVIRYGGPAMTRNSFTLYFEKSEAEKHKTFLANHGIEAKVRAVPLHETFNYTWFGNWKWYHQLATGEHVTGGTTV